MGHYLPIRELSYLTGNFPTCQGTTYLGPYLLGAILAYPPRQDGKGKENYSDQRDVTGESLM